MWASLGRESKGASTDNRADELANLNHQVKKLEIANGNLRSKIESLNDALVNLGNERNTLEDNLEEECARSARAAGDKSATIAELAVRFGRAELAFMELKDELGAIREASNHVRIPALLHDIDKDFKEIRSKISKGLPKSYAQPGIREQINQRFDHVQAQIPERIERLLQELFPRTTNSGGLGIVSRLIFWLATMLIVVVLYITVQTVLSAVAHSGRIGFTIGFCGLASILSGVYLVVGIPLVCIGSIIIVKQSLRKRSYAGAG